MRGGQYGPLRPKIKKLITSFYDTSEQAYTILEAPSYGENSVVGTACIQGGPLINLLRQALDKSG